MYGNLSHFLGSDHEIMSGSISLGTSDTIFALLGEPSPKIEGHVFGSPIDPEGYMSLICFTNGSLVRCVPPLRGDATGISLCSGCSCHETDEHPPQLGSS